MKSGLNDVLLKPKYEGIFLCVCVFLDEFVITVGAGCVNIIACGHFGQEDLWQVIEFRKGRRDGRGNGSVGGEAVQLQYEI